MDSKKDIKGINNKEPSISEIISLSKFTLTGVTLFLLTIGLIVIFQQFHYLDQNESLSRMIIGLVGFCILFTFVGIIIDFLRYRKYSNWGALGAIISYLGILVFFLPLFLYMAGLGNSSIYLVSIIIGIIIIIIGFTSRYTEFDKQIETLLWTIWNHIRNYDFRALPKAIYYFFKSIIVGTFSYLWYGLKNLPNRIKMIILFFWNGTKQFLKGVAVLSIKVGNQIKSTLITIKENFHFVGLVSIIIYLLSPGHLPNNRLIDIELLLVLLFFFILGVIYPHKERITKLFRIVRRSLIKRTIITYSMLSGVKLELDKSIFCSRCLRGILAEEIEPLKEVKRDVKCPFCGYEDWVMIK